MSMNVHEASTIDGKVAAQMGELLLANVKLSFAVDSMKAEISNLRASLAAKARDDAGVSNVVDLPQQATPA